MPLPTATLPTAAELHQYLGWGTPDAEQAATATAHIAAVRDAAYNRTRGVGFTSLTVMASDLRNLILAAAGRSLSNPTSAKRLEAGNFSEVPANAGWLLSEVLVLDSYRVMATGHPAPVT